MVTCRREEAVTQPAGATGGDGRVAADVHRDCAIDRPWPNDAVAERRELAVVVDGRATAVDSVESPDVEVTTDVETFVMLAAGRIDPQAQIDAGRISWSGDGQWGETAARNLTYTM